MDVPLGQFALATPEGAVLRLELADIGRRIAAAFVDLLLKVAVLYAIGRALLPLDEWGLALGFTIIFSIWFGYDIVLEVLTNGCTAGKALVGIRVVRTDGLPVDVVTSAVRNVARLIEGEALMWVPGLITLMSTRNRQRIGDVAAGTIVLRAPRRT